MATLTPTETAEILKIPLMTLYTKINRQTGIGIEFKKTKGTWAIEKRIVTKYKKASQGPRI